MSENDRKNDFWISEANILKFIDENGKNCQFQPEDQRINFSDQIHLGTT